VSTTEAAEEIVARPSRPTGPRAEAREEAILDAAIDLLKEVGYDRFTMDSLAERARAGKATIYRHWSGKPQVVVAALKHWHGESVGPFPVTGTLRGDLIGAISMVCDAVGEGDAAILAGVVSAMRSDPELAELVRSQILDSKKGEFDEIVGRAVRSGELPPGSTADPVDEVVPAILMFRMVFEGQPVDEAFATHVVDAIALPLLHR
jgi:AcrR family transcriptional regulator